MTPDPFAIFQPDAEELLRRVSRHVDDALLKEIAAADYGHKVEENLTHLTEIRNRGLFVIPMGWRPREVLELIRWSKPEDPQWKPGQTGERGHWMRAFACSALLRAAGETSNSGLREGWNQTLIQLMGSLRSIGPELYEPAAASLAWLITRVDEDGGDEELGFFVIGLLLLALNAQAVISDAVIVSLSERVAEEVGRVERISGWPGQGLLGATTYNSYRADWKNLGVALAEMELSKRSGPVRDWVKLIGIELAGTRWST
jgi:hypothetical protein